MLHSRLFRDLLQEQLGADFSVFLAMRYQNPSIESSLEQLRQQRPSRIVVFPLFPQYASATVGSVHQEVMRIVKRWHEIPKLHFIDCFFDHPKVIETFAVIGKEYIAKEPYDHVLFTFHGLPERQLTKNNPRCLGVRSCCDGLHAGNYLCYRAQCFATSRSLADALGLTRDGYTVSFQSRLGRDPWIQPYTEDALETLAAQGVRKVLAFAPSFVADCLETTIEVSHEYDKLFKEKGGERLQLVESLNGHQLWVEAASEIITEHL